MTRRQRRDLRVKLSATQSRKSSHCPFLLLNVSRKAVNTNFYSLCFDVLGIEPRSANRFSSRRSIYSTTDRNIYLFSCHWTASDANLVDDPHTFHCNGFFVIGGIRCSCFSSSFQLGVSNVPVVFFEFLSTEFAACLKPASRNNHQRWSRGHKARGQGQGHKKNPRPRPRTAFPRTDTLEAKDRNARGQGQGPRTQSASALQKKKKKGLHKNFSGDLHEKTLSKNFSTAPQNFNFPKNSAVLEPRTGQFSRT